MPSNDDSTAATSHGFEVTAVPPFSDEFRIGRVDSIEDAVELIATAEDSKYQPTEYRLKREGTDE